MAKTLHDPTPASAVARLFDPALAQRATQRHVASQPSPHSESVAVQERPTHIKRECTLTASTDEALSRVTELIRRSTGARVNASTSMRALLRLVSIAWPRLEDELRALGTLRVPSNGPGSEVRRQHIEERIAAAIARAIRSVGCP